jgi:hypothetical protein
MATEKPVDEFDGFFDQLSRLKTDEKPPADFGAAPATETPVVTDGEAQPVVATETPVVADPPATETPEGKAQATGDDGEPVVEPVGEPVVEAAKPVQGDNTELLTRLADMLSQRQPSAPVVQAQQPQAAPIYTEEEVARLRQFEQDWPDFAEALRLFSRGTTVQNNAYVFNELARVMGPQLQNMQTVQIEHQYDALRRSIPDYDVVRDPVIKWVKEDPKLPAYLRTAYSGVIDNGDVGEITDLVNRWRDATGKQTPRAAPPVKSANDLSPAAKQAAAALAPVVTKRATIIRSEPEGFDAAFDEFAKA